MRFSALATALMLCTGSTAFAASDDAMADIPAMAAPASPLVQAFVQNAGIGNQFEMTISQIALEKSQDPNVRRFAATMLKDHHMAEVTLDQAAAHTGVNTHFMFDNAHQAKIDELQGLSGQAFDEDYWIIQRNAHAEAVAGLGDYAMSGSNPVLRAWARATLPVVVGHQRMIADMTGTSAVALR